MHATPATTPMPATTTLKCDRTRPPDYTKSRRLEPRGVVELHLVVDGDVGLRGVRAARAPEEIVPRVVPRALRGRLPVEGADAPVVGQVPHDVVGGALLGAVLGDHELHVREHAGEHRERV